MMETEKQELKRNDKKGMENGLRAQLNLIVYSVVCSVAKDY